MKNDAKIQITKDGPYLVSGGLPLSEQRIMTNAEGESLDYREDQLEDTDKQVSGPIWVRGGIPVIAADGKP